MGKNLEEGKSPTIGRQSLEQCEAVPLGGGGERYYNCYADIPSLPKGCELIAPDSPTGNGTVYCQQSLPNLQTPNSQGNNR